MVLLPAMMRDQITEVAGTLLSVDPTLTHVLLAIVAVLVLSLPLVVFFLLLGDLTRFYFHAQHVSGGSTTVFAPRFTLTGLRLPVDDLSAPAAESLKRMREHPHTLELIVPPNPRGRGSIDRKLDAYGLRRSASATDLERVNGLFELLASRDRSLAEEVAKVEFGLARHLLRLQVIVIRYVKALLAFLVTALAVFSAAAVIARDRALDRQGQLWLSVIFVVWAPVMVVAVSSPVRWVESLLRAEDATAHSIAADVEFTKFERFAVALGLAVLALAGVVLVVRLADDVEFAERCAALVCLAAAALAFLRGASRSPARRRRDAHR